MKLQKSLLEHSAGIPLTSNHDASNAYSKPVVPKQPDYILRCRRGHDKWPPNDAGVTLKSFNFCFTAGGLAQSNRVSCFDMMKERHARTLMDHILKTWHRAVLRGRNALRAECHPFLQSCFIWCSLRWILIYARIVGMHHTNYVK